MEIIKQNSGQAQVVVVQGNEPTLSEMVALWIDKKLSRQSVSVRKNYPLSIRRFCKYLNGENWQAAILPTNANDIDTYIDGLGSSNTKSVELAAIRSFYKFCTKEGIIKQDVSALANSVKIEVSAAKEKTAFSMSEVKLLLDATDELPKHLDQLRARVQILLMCTSGLRRVEIERANLSDIQGNAIFVQGKGKKEKSSIRAIQDITLKAIAEYQKARVGEGIESDALLVSHGNKSKGKRLSAQVMSRTVRALKEKTGLQDLDLHNTKTAHSLRHTFGTEMLKQTNDVNTVAIALGHASTKYTIKTYAKKEAQRQAVEAVTKVDFFQGQ